MGAAAEPTVKDLVLVGGGHSHVAVLKLFGMIPMAGVQLTLITRDVETPYSGMLPGYCAGLYSKRECHIDLVKLAQFAKARVVHAEATGLDTERRRVNVGGGRPSIAYDVVSIDIGSCPKPIAGASALPAVTPVKPIDGFCARWDRLLERLSSLPPEATVRLVVVGGGAGGVELTLAMQARLRSELSRAGADPRRVTVTLVSRSRQLMPQHSSGVRACFARLLDERGVKLHLGVEVLDAQPEELLCSGGLKLDYDEVVWCTQGGAQDWLRDASPLALDEGGFIAVHPSLESVSHRSVFAAGDVAAVLAHPRPKAGVFAVRQGIPLAHNLRRALVGEAPQPYTPQTSFLGLIGTGDGGCVASRGALALEADWLWELKDWIDRFWMKGYTELPKMESETPSSSDVAKAAGDEALAVLSHASMRCGGCGAKVGATVLSRVMKRLRDEGHLPPPRKEVLVGLDSPDDCAVLAPSPLASVHSVDFFRSFIDDPYVFGKIAANHALSDCHAMGAPPTAALAIAVVPFAVESKVEETFYQMMCGACSVLSEAGCDLVGGHTCEGVELSLGFCVTGHAAPEALLSKGGLSAGQALILTKPIGTGALFAAQMRGAAGGGAVANALSCMAHSNKDAAACLCAHGASACTDVTGFGLLGHLHEMASASRAAVTLRLADVPLLPGALDCVRANIFSSLQPANLRLRRAVANEADAVHHSSGAYPLLFDPQTAGGLLAAVPAAAAPRCIAALRELGYTEAAVVGEVTANYGEDVCPSSSILVE